MSNSKKSSIMSQSLRSDKKNNSASKFSASKKSLQSGSLTLKQKLVNFLIKASQIERKLEIVKQTLCEEEQFTPESAFHRIDVQRKGYILEQDLQRFLNDNKVQYKGAELKILYGKMNVDQSDSGVLLWEFQNFILPNQKPRLRYFTMRRPVYVPLPGERLAQKIEWLLSKLFLEIMKEKALLKEINAALISSYDFNPATVFNLVANLEGYITGESLNSFMYNEGVQISVEQIGCLMRLIDKHGEGRLCLEDFRFFLATMRLKKEHEIFDELSPIPALKNFVVPLLESIYDRQGTLKERVISNKLNGRSPQKVLGRSGNRQKSIGSHSKRNHN